MHVPGVNRLCLVGALAALALVAATGAGASSVKPASAAPSGFRLALTEGHGGTIWTGRIPDRALPADPRSSAIYLPPHYSPRHRYPVIYLLHGMPGSPSSFVHSLNIAGVADSLIAGHQVPPFIAVMPFGGPRKHRNQGEWAGSWERFVVSDVVPWADAQLSTVASASARTLAGLSAGGFGAVNIGLRNPGVFGTLESWNGYFTPFRDGPFAQATRAELRANTPTLLVQSRPAVRFFLSTGEAHGGIDPGSTLSFGKELAALGLPYRLWVLPANRGHFYRSQLPDALRFALADLPPAYAQS